MGNLLASEESFSSEEPNDIIIELGNCSPRPIFMKYDDPLESRIDIELELSDSDLTIPEAPVFESTHSDQDDLMKVIEKNVIEVTTSETFEPEQEQTEQEQTEQEQTEQEQTEQEQTEQEQTEQEQTSEPEIETQRVPNWNLIDSLYDDLPAMKVMSLDRFPKELARYAGLFDEILPETNAAVRKLLIKVCMIAISRFPATGVLHNELLVPFIDEIFLRLDHIDTKTVERLALLYQECGINGYNRYAERILQNTIDMDTKISLESAYLPTISWQALVVANICPNLSKKYVEGVVAHYLDIIEWESCDSSTFNSLVGIMSQTQDLFPELYDICQEIIIYDIPVYRSSDDIMLCYLTIYVASKSLDITPNMKNMVEFVSNSNNYCSSTCEIVDMISNEMIEDKEYSEAYTLLSVYIHMVLKNSSDKQVNNILKTVKKLYCVVPTPENSLLLVTSLLVSMKLKESAVIIPIFIHCINYHPDMEFQLLSLLKSRVMDGENKDVCYSVTTRIITSCILKNKEIPYTIYQLVRIICLDFNENYTQEDKFGIMKMFTSLIPLSTNMEYIEFKDWLITNWENVVAGEEDRFIHYITMGTRIYKKNYLEESATILKRLLRD